MAFLMKDIPSLTAAFPSLESLTMEDCEFDLPSGPPQEGHPLFRELGGSLHTLVLDMYQYEFTTQIRTTSEPYRLFNLAALTGLRNLVVPVDFFISLTDIYGKVCICCTGITVILPASLRCLTLIFNDDGCELMTDGETSEEQIREFLRKNAPAILNSFPQLEKIDLGDDLDSYRQHDVETVASRR